MENVWIFKCGIVSHNFYLFEFILSFINVDICVAPNLKAWRMRTAPHHVAFNTTPVAILVRGANFPSSTFAKANGSLVISEDIVESNFWNSLHPFVISTMNTLCVWEFPSSDSSIPHICLHNYVAIVILRNWNIRKYE